MRGYELLDCLGRCCGFEDSTSLPTLTYWRDLLCGLAAKGSFLGHQGTYSPEFVEGVFSGIQGMLGLWTGSLMSVVVRSAEAGLKGAKGG